MTKQQIKLLISKTGTKLEIQSAVFRTWKLADRPIMQKPYKDE